ncbi:MAG: molybdopterin-dependent oxidoreductase [Planctomycetota bacterium]
MPIFSTACPRNCYSTCTMRVEVEGGRLRRIEADPANLATSPGVCLKGLSYVERVASPDRLRTPLVRVPGTDRFAPAGWGEVLERIAAVLRRLRAAPGPRSVLYYAGSGTKGLLNGLGRTFWRLYGGCTTTYGDLCWPAGLEATRLTLGANEHNAPWDLPNARLIVLWGKNPAETNIHQMPFVEAAIARGARLVAIDPRRTPSAERADLLIQPRPGTDGALAFGAAHLLVARGHVDREFVAAHVLGYDDFCARVQEFPPARAAEICDVPAAAVEELAELLGTVKPATVVAGFGMQRYTNSGQTMRAMIALVALTGNLGRPGAGWQFANLQTDVFGAVPDPLAFYPSATGDDPIRVSISTARLGAEMLATREPPLRMAWVERGNPLLQNPDSHRVRAAFRALEFRVVVDQFLTDTAREADVVLPAKTMFEQSDVIGAYWHPYVQLKRKVLDPPGEVRPESEIWAALARRLGVPEAEVAAAFPGSSDAEVEAWLAQQLARFPELTLARLRAGPALSPAYRAVAFADGVFPTPSGRIELRSAEAARRWGVDPLPDYREPVRTPPDAPRAGAPALLELLTPNTKNRIHSQFANLRSLRDVEGPPRASLHPADAHERGIAEDDPVRLRNARGELRARARLDHGQRRGIVFVPNGAWSEDGAAVNRCSEGRETDLGHGAAFHGVLVEVERDER